MSRKYVNDKWCVRCGRKTHCPYLKKNIKLFDGKTVVDIGCGNGRNSIYMKNLGYKVAAVDMAVEEALEDGINAHSIVLGHDKLPFNKGHADIILANYVFMFLNMGELCCVLSEIQRISHRGSKLMIELYPAKDSYCKNDHQCKILFDYILLFFSDNGWKYLRKSKNRLILERTDEKHCKDKEGN